MPEEFSQPVTPSSRLLSMVLLAYPVISLSLLAGWHKSGALGVGVAVALMIAILIGRQGIVWRAPAVGSTVLYYIICLGWVWFVTQGKADAWDHFVRGALLLGAVGLTVVNDFQRTGAEPRRKAAKHCRKLKSRVDWPNPLTKCKDLPEVQALAELVQLDLGPVSTLLQDPRPEIRAAVFCALADRPFWRPNEARLVLAAAYATLEPGVRAVAAAAVCTVEDPETLAEVAGFLKDPSGEVRQVVIEALMADGGTRWPVIREYVKAALSEPRFAHDGALPGLSGRIPLVAVVDFTGWTCEGEPLAARSGQTLLEHYAVQLRGEERYLLTVTLSQQILDPLLPAWLRSDLANLLRQNGLLGPDLLDSLTNADQPAPLRLMAAELLLSLNPSDSDGLDVLRGLGRQPNREMAVAIARILQQYLGFPFGLPDGPIATNSKQAIDVSRRVLAWASGKPFGLSPTTNAAAGVITDLPGFDLGGPFDPGPYTGPQSAIS